MNLQAVKTSDLIALVGYKELLQGNQWGNAHFQDGEGDEG
jgi:hypothetical protein